MAAVSFSSLKLGINPTGFLSNPSQPRLPLKLHCQKHDHHDHQTENHAVKKTKQQQQPPEPVTTQKNRANKLPPGPRKWPLIGNLHNLAGLGLPHHGLAQLAEEHGPIMHLQLGEISSVVISSARLAQEVMKTYDHIFGQRPIDLLASKILSYDGTDLVYSKGEYWKQMRKVCVTELLGPRKVKSFASIRESEVSNLVEWVRQTSGTPFNFTEKALWLTNMITCRAAFGDKWQDQEGVIKMARESLSLAGGFDLADVFPSLEILSVITGMKPRLMEMRAKLDQVLDRILEEHKQKKPEDEEDLLDVLLRLQASGTLSCPITTDNVKAVVWDMFVAGTDTTSTTTEWLMSELMRNPRVMKKAQAEVRQALKGKTEICEEDIQGLPYLKLIIKETLRLHPPVPLLLPRESNTDWELDGYKIPYKTKLIVNGWAIGRDPTYWDDAESFIPERFSDNSIDFKGFNFEYIPFGAGRRICPGMTFAQSNIELPVAYLLNFFDWSLPNGIAPQDLEMSEGFGVTAARKNHLYLIATPHVPASLDEPCQPAVMEAVN